MIFWIGNCITFHRNKISDFRIAKVSKEDADAHEKCAKAADTVAKHAACVSQLLRAQSVKEGNEKRDMKELFSKLKPESIHRPVDASTPPPELPFKFEGEEEEETTTTEQSKVQKQENRQMKSGSMSKTEYFKRKFREGSVLKFDPNSPKKIRNQHHYKGLEFRSRKKRVAVRSDDAFQLRSSQTRMTPIGLIAKNLLKRVLEIKNKTEAVP